MKTVVLTGYGDVDKFEIRDMPEPKVRANQIKVRMAGASINPVDWKQRSGAIKAFMPLQFPAILGRDVSGKVVEVGEGVSAFNIGDAVMGRVSGGYAEYVVSDTEDWAIIPRKLDLVDAGALPLVLLTGAQLVDEGADPRQGERLLVTGATGSVGRVAVFVAKERGATVYAGVRKARKAEAAELGADAVVALDDEKEIGDLPLLKCIADTVGGKTISRLLDKLSPGGTIGSVVGEPAGAKDRGFTVRAMLTHSDSKQLSALARAVAEGKLVIPIAKRFPLEQVRAAQQLAEKGAGGKVLLVA